MRILRTAYGCFSIMKTSDAQTLACNIWPACTCCHWRCGRTGATLEGSLVVQAALPELPQLYVPDVDSLDQTCTKMQDSKQGIRLLEVVGAPGRGAPACRRRLCL